MRFQTIDLIQQIEDERDAGGIQSQVAIEAFRFRQTDDTQT